MESKLSLGSFGACFCLAFNIIKLEPDGLQMLHPRSVSLGSIKRSLATLQNLMEQISLLDLRRTPMKAERDYLLIS